MDSPEQAAKVVAPKPQRFSPTPEAGAHFASDFYPGAKSSDASQPSHQSSDDDDEGEAAWSTSKELPRSGWGRPAR